MSYESSELKLEGTPALKKTRRKFSDHDILVIQELNKEFPDCTTYVIGEIIGILRTNIPRIIKGDFKCFDNTIKLDNEKYQEIKVKIQNKLKDKTESDQKKFQELRKRKAINARCCSVQTMKDLIKEKLTDESYEEISNKEKYKKLDGTHISSDIINNICNGKTKLFLEDFDSQKEYDEYLKIISTTKSIDSGKRRIKK